MSFLVEFSDVRATKEGHVVNSVAGKTYDVQDTKVIAQAFRGPSPEVDDDLWIERDAPAQKVSVPDSGTDRPIPRCWKVIVLGKDETDS